MERGFYSEHKLCYTTHIRSQFFEIEGGWSAHGNEESSEEASEEGGQEEVVVAS